MAADELKRLIDDAMEVEVAEYGDEASKEFYRLLKEREFKTTRCKSCADVALPPRMFCPACFGTNIEWIDLPRRGKLYAFSQQERALRFNKPDVIGIVELEGAGRLISKIDAPLDELSIDMEVEMNFLDVSENQTLHEWRPTTANG